MKQNKESVMDKIIKTIKDKVLNTIDYVFVHDIPENLKLKDNVLLYNTGDTWKIVPLKLALSYPIIYDKFN